MTPARTWFPAQRAMLLAGLGVVVFAVCYGSAQFFKGTPGVTAFWPVNALVLAFVLRLCRTTLESRLALAVTLVAMIASNLAMGRALPTALAFPLANVVEIAVAVWFMRGIAMPLSGLRDLGQFLLGAVLAGPLVSTLMAGLFMAGALGLTGQDLVEQGAAWLLADVMGMAIVAPFALSLGSVARGGWLKALAVPAVIGLICFGLCWQHNLPVVFLAYPLLAWAVLNDRERGGALGVGAVAIAVLGAALMGEGPIARLPRFDVDPGIAVPVFFGALVLTVFPLSALLKELDILNAELDRRRAAAENDSAAKSELLGRVGEEIRSPLTGVVTVAEMLRSGRLGDLNARQRDLLARIAESGAEIETLAREMVVLAEGGEVNARSASVADILDEAAAAARFRAHRSRITLEVEAADAALRAAIDPDRLKRLVVDALGGALDAAPKGSVVRVAADLEDAGTVRIVIDDAGEDALDRRLARFAAASFDGPAASGLAFDRAELRRIGGDLRLIPGPLGGGRFSILAPRQAPDAARAAA